MINNANAYERVLLALMTWREARGESVEAQRGVIHVVLNRVASGVTWWGKDIIGCILAPWQFSSFNPRDPNATRFPQSADPVFREIILLAADPGEDPTGGATSYYSGDSVPDWAASMQKTCDIGAFHFYKLAAQTATS